MKKLIFAIMLIASTVLLDSQAHAQAWRPRTQVQVYTAPAPQPYVYQQRTRIYTYQPSRVRTYRAYPRGIMNARMHGGEAHAYGLRKQRFARMNRER